MYPKQLGENLKSFKSESTKFCSAVASEAHEEGQTKQSDAVCPEAAQRDDDVVREDDKGGQRRMAVDCEIFLTCGRSEPDI